MDTTRDPKKPNGKSELGSEKQSRDSSGPDVIEIDGEVIQLPEDLKDLQEIDYEDPEVQAWMAAQEAESVRLYGKLTYAEGEYLLSRRADLEKQYPQKSVVERNQIALGEFRAANRNRG